MKQAVIYYITGKVLDDLAAITKRAYPFEACSFLISEKEDTRRIVDVLPVTNVRRAIGSFAITKSDYAKARNITNKSIAGIYHSHTLFEATPSEDDKTLISNWPQYVFAIGSLDNNTMCLLCNAYKYNNVIIERIRLERTAYD